MEDKQMNISRIRKQKGYSQREIADLSGISIRTIQRVENGKTVARGDTLQRIAKTLGVEVEAFYNPQLKEHNPSIQILVLSQLSFLIFPALGVVVPGTIWLMQKDSVQGIKALGKRILKFQLLWLSLLVIFYFLYAVDRGLHVGMINFRNNGLFLLLAFYYSINLFWVAASWIKMKNKLV